MDIDKLMNKKLTRAFDHCKTIPEETLQQLLRFLRSTPTSVNIQPNHFYVLATPEGKKHLAANLGARFQNNSEKIPCPSHAILLTPRADGPDSHLQEVFDKENAGGRFPDPEKR